MPEASSRRHISWELFREQVLTPGIPARLALGGDPAVWLSLRGQTLSLSTPVPAGTVVPASPLRYVRLRASREGERTLLELSMEREDLYREFFFLALGIADMVQVQHREAVAAFIECLIVWRELLQSAARMSEEQVLGLLGELWTLRRVIANAGPAGLDAWTGPRGEPHDFRLSRLELEVKSTRSMTRTHVVHGLGQFVPSRNCRLFLLSLQWEPAGAADGLTLPSAIDAVRADLTLAPDRRAVFDAFMRDHFHYRQEDAALYAERVRLRTSPRLIKVDAKFPRLTSAMAIAHLGEPASRISDVTYRINVDGMGVAEESAQFRRLLP